MSRLDGLVAAYPLPSWRLAAWLVVLLVGGVLAWAYTARLDEVAMAPGEIVPQGQVKTVQHLEGGIIQRIHVTEGQSVAKGDALVNLELGLGSANTEEIRVQIDGLLLKRARIEAEAADRKLTFPQEIAKRRPLLVGAERKGYDSRRRQIESALLVLKKQVRQRQLEVKELEAKRRGRNANLRLAEERLRMSTSLLDKDLVSRMEHLSIENEAQNLRTELSELTAAIPRARASLDEARERERSERLKFRRTIVEELGQVELAIARNQQLMTRATNQDRRTSIRSPIDGVVKNLRYHTIGGVVRAGEPLMEIVPSREELVVEVRLDPVDVGYVSAGQPAVVKLLTYDFVRYGGLDGKVVSVAPDSSTDREGRPFYRVIVHTAKAYMGDRPGRLPIIPGMQATIDIHTGRKTVLEYLITPVLKLKYEAFRER